MRTVAASAPSRPSLSARIAVVLLTLGGAVAGNRLLSPLLANRIPFLTFYPALFVSSWHGGWLSGAASTMISAAFIAYFWLDPVGSFWIEDLGEAVALLIFVATGLAIAAVHERLLVERARHRAARVDAERAAEQAQKAEREVAATNRAKDEFLSMLSHELRTPLTAILGWANMLRGRELAPAARARALEVIERNAQAQAQLIEDVLDVSRIVMGKLRIEPVATDAASAIRAAVDVVRPAADAKQIELVATTPDVGALYADPHRLQQIVWNLLSNAVKFTPRGGRVEVRLDRTEGRVRVAVADSGEGIAPDFLPHVFEHFRQAETGAKRSRGGLGLGLAIVKRLVELHGGAVRAESRGLGQGATFVVELPVRAEMLLEEPAPRAAGAPSAATLEDVRVLVVDDDGDARDLVAVVLEERGAIVKTASSAADGMQLLCATPVDVLVADIDMPGESGYEMLARVRELSAEDKRGVRALALTACVGARDVVLAREAGFLAHVPKPVLPAELVRVIASVLDQRATPG